MNQQHIDDIVANYVNEQLDRLFDSGLYSSASDTYTLTPKDIRKLIAICYADGRLNEIQHRIDSINEKLDDLENNGGE